MGPASVSGVSVEMRVGRLVEVRLYGPFKLADTNTLISSMVAILPRLGASQLVVSCTDVRHARPAGPEVMEPFMVAMRAANARLERDATIIGADPVVRMQAARMVAEGHHPGRRVCSDEPQVLEWLGPCLTPAEGARLREFLSEARAPEGNRRAR